MRSHDYYVRSHDHHVRSHDPPLLLGTDDESIEVSIDDGGSQSAEFSDQLHEQFLHQLVDHATQSWLVQQRAWCSYPPAKKYGHLENFFHKAEKFSCSCKIVVSGEKISVPVKMLELQVGVKILICGHFVQPCVYHSSQNPKIFSDVKKILLRVWKIFCG